MADFSPALAYILPNEAGYVNNPSDKGGPTNYGITQRTLDAWNAAHPEMGFPASVADLTPDQAGAIYQADYWPDGMEQITSQAVASKMLDIMVNFGVSGGMKIIQQAANTLVTPGTAVDGNLGPDAINTINSADESDMLAALVAALTVHYQSIAASDPSQQTFLAGWLARAARTPGIIAIAGGAGLFVLLLIGALIWLNSQGRA